MAGLGCGPQEVIGTVLLVQELRLGVLQTENTVHQTITSMSTCLQNVICSFPVVSNLIIKRDSSDVQNLEKFSLLWKCSEW